MITTTVETQRKQNVGRAVLNYLEEQNIKGKVEVLTIHTERNCATRTKTTTFKYKFK